MLFILIARLAWCSLNRFLTVKAAVLGLYESHTLTQTVWSGADPPVQEALPAAVQHGGRAQGGARGHLAQLPPQEQALSAGPQ